MGSQGRPCRWGQNGSAWIHFGDQPRASEEPAPEDLLHGGFYDHVAPPPDSPADHQPYGTRVPLLALGRFARKNQVSHVTLEHSSIVRFIEFNFLNQTGQLGARDAIVNNLGSLLDPAQTGKPIPE